MTFKTFSSPIILSLMLAASSLSATGTGEDAMVMTSRETPEAACAKGDPVACTVAALQILPSDREGAEHEQAAARARALFEKGCEGGDPDACRHLGQLLKDGEIYRKDLDEASRLLERACTIGDERSCRLRAAVAYDDNDHEGRVLWLGRS